MNKDLEQINNLLLLANTIVLSWDSSQPLHPNFVAMCGTLRQISHSISQGLDRMCDGPLGLESANSEDDNMDDSPETDEDSEDMSPMEYLSSDY